jgi:hypothetical protein
MGCDIHACVERQEYVSRGDGRWGFTAEVWLHRDYTMFAHMADVRNHYDVRLEPVAPRRDWSGREGAEGVDPWTVDQLKDHGDHSHSWLDTEEFAEAISRTRQRRSVPIPIGAEYEATLAYMLALEKAGQPARIVFSFDN